MGHRYELTDDEWERLKDLLPPENTGRGRPSKPNRKMLNGILWVARSGAPWRDLPERFGPWQTVYERFTVWSDANIFEEIFELLNLDADLQDLSIDSTSCKVHPHAAGAKKGQKMQKRIKESVCQEAEKTQKSMPSLTDLVTH